MTQYSLYCLPLSRETPTRLRDPVGLQQTLRQRGLAHPRRTANEIEHAASHGVIVPSVGQGVGLLGGLNGLGGAEFRLPVLITVFGFAALEAVILNKVMSLVVVAAALPARLAVVPFPDLLAHWPAVVNLLAGGLVGAWLGCLLGDQDALGAALSGAGGAARRDGRRPCRQPPW